MCVDNKTMKAEKRELKGEEEDFDMTHISERSSSYQIRIYLWTKVKKKIVYGQKTIYHNKIRYGKEGSP